MPSSHPFGDAVKVWHFAGPDGLRESGAVQTGVELDGAEREASLARGGDGSVARLEGGLLATESGLQITGKQMTLLIRARDRSEKWTGTLLAEHSPGTSCEAILFGSASDIRALGIREQRRLQDTHSIEFLWRTSPLHERVIPEALDTDSPYSEALAKKQNANCRSGLLSVAAMVGLIGPGLWHDILLRFDGPKLELYIDGVLVDEEYPHGELRMFASPLLIGAEINAGKVNSCFNGEVDHIAVWDRALSDSEIVVLSGGPEQVARRRLAIEGPPEPHLQYWRPPGYNMFVGDPMTFFHDGVFHLFYLTDRNHGAQKWGIGAHPWGHVSSSDLIHWDHHPRALEFSEQSENSMGTGQIVFQHGTYYLYWINHGRRMPWKDAPEHRLADNIYLATSRDGVHFEKHIRQPWAQIDYRSGGDSNPLIWKSAHGDRYFLYCPNNQRTDPPNAMPPWLFESENLETWTRIPSPNFADTFPKGWNSCATYHKWNGWYYFHNLDVYWMSRRSLEDPEADQTVHRGLALGVHVPEWSTFHDNRRIGVGWGTGLGYAGEAVFRELVQFPDGRLGTKWPEEMIPESGAPLDSIPHTFSLAAEGATACRSFSNIPQDVRITAKVVPGPGASGFGLSIRATSGQGPEGPSFWFDPGKERVECRVSKDIDTGKDRFWSNYLKGMVLSGSRDWISPS